MSAAECIKLLGDAVSNLADLLDAEADSLEERDHSSAGERAVKRMRFAAFVAREVVLESSEWPETTVNYNGFQTRT